VRRGLNLKTLARVWILAGFGLGVLSAALWLHSTRVWQEHLLRNQMAGVLLYHSLQGEAPLPAGLTGVVLPAVSGPEQSQSVAQWIRQQADVPGPGFITEVSIQTAALNTAGSVRPGAGLGATVGAMGGTALRLVILSDSRRYAVADLETAALQTAAEKLGAVTRLLATYCSNAIVFAHLGEGPWQQIEGAELWGCAASPRDLRLPAVLLAALGLAIALSQSGEVTARFGAFADLLRQRRSVGGPDSYSTRGPEELRDIVTAVNAHLAGAREQIAKRATVLSGVSHDLGTPATRLRLRAALIQDRELRHRLEADIDSMTGMIESVLTYTRSELSLELPRQISLSALVEALVADYQDLGKPVTYLPWRPEGAPGAQSLFSARAGQTAQTPQTEQTAKAGQTAQTGLPDARRVLVTARPILLQRALTNLVDNALKYGRRAEVRLEATSESAVITVQDEGSELTVAEIEAVLAPFQRGANSTAIDGFGLGLTIVATVAEQHGGSLRFERGRRGLRARLEIRRS
jgi:signal transduction histidine kinase